MSDIRPLISIFAVGCAALLVGISVPATARAAEAPLILRMADGQFYHPHSGTLASSEAELLAKIGGTASAVVVAPTAPQTPPAPAVEKPLILRMADGKYYHPASGRMASSEADLLSMIGWAGGSTIGSPSQAHLAPVLRAAYRAQEELRNRIRAQGKEKRYPMEPIGQDAPRNVTIAVWNQVTDEITYVEGVKQGRDLEIEGGSPVGISVRLTNWINSDYATNDPNHLVVAVRYPIFHEIKDGTRVIRYDVEEAVYTPYNRTLHQPEVILEGERVLDETIAKAAQDLDRRGLASRSVAGKSMTDTVDETLLKALVVLEHTSVAEIRANPAQAVGKVFATIGLNPGTAYNYAGSSAGAFGLAQFIPSTYNRLAARPELGLHQDFRAGMQDHQNALKASYAYLDAVLRELPPEARALPANDVKLMEYLAAAYNGGASRVFYAIRIWDDQISGAIKPANILTRARLQPETIDYVKKLRSVLPVLLGPQARPTAPAGST